MTISSAPKTDAHPPLARDAAGNLQPVPAGTSALRICRETQGRPGMLRGPDKNPFRFPLHTTCEELVELCGAGVYRVYAIDHLGELLDEQPIAKWDLTAPAREPRNAVMDPMLAVRAERSQLAAPATAPSDLRFALETMAAMMRTNTDALRLVAESQVDLAKAIATAKGLPRNAAMFTPPPPVANQNADEEEEEDDEDDDGGQPDWMETLVPIAGAVAHSATTAIMDRFSKPAAAGKTDAGKTDAGKTDAGKPGPGFELADLLDWRRPQKRAQQQEQQRQEQEQQRQEQPPEQVPVITRQAVISKAMALAPLLEPDERARLMRLAPVLMKQLDNPVVAQSLAELFELSDEEAIEWVRVHLAEIERGVPS